MNGMVMSVAISLLVTFVLLALFAFSAINASDIERRVPPDGVFLDVDGAQLHYTDDGEGPTLIILHGLGGQLRNFRYALLERLVPNFRVILVDRPGSGYSVATTDGFPSLSEQASSVADLIVRLQLDRPLLIGHSLGGALSLTLALDHPSRISGLALIAPLTRHDLEEVPDAFRMLRIRSPFVRWLIAWTLVAPASRLMSPDRRAVVFDPDPVPVDFETAGGGALALRPIGFQAASSDLMQIPRDLPRVEAGYRNLRLPLEILFGRDDRILDPAVHGERLAAEVSHARLELVPGGHMLPVSRPDVTAKWIEAAHARVSRHPSVQTRSRY